MYLFVNVLVEDDMHKDEPLPLKDTDDAFQPEQNIRHSQPHATGTGKTMSTKHSDDRSEPAHTEL